MSDADEFMFDENYLKSRPLMLSDIKEKFRQIDMAYQNLEKCDEETRQIMQPILDMALNFICDLCYDLGFEDPMQIKWNEGYGFCVKPGDGKGGDE